MSVAGVDAIYFSSRALSEQVAPHLLSRELIKAWAGFSGDYPESPKAQFHRVATGKWGCGVFNGYPALKAVVQWLVCSAAGRTMHFYAFGDVTLVGQLNAASRAAVAAGLSVGSLATALFGVSHAIVDGVRAAGVGRTPLQSLTDLQRQWGINAALTEAGYVGAAPAPAAPSGLLGRVLGGGGGRGGGVYDVGAEADAFLRCVVGLGIAVQRRAVQVNVDGSLSAGGGVVPTAPPPPPPAEPAAGADDATAAPTASGGATGVEATSAGGDPTADGVLRGGSSGTAVPAADVRATVVPARPVVSSTSSTGSVTDPV